MMGMILSEEAKEAAFKLYLWQYTDQNFYTCRLYDLFSKADLFHLGKLAAIYPAEVAVFREWRAEIDPLKFFLKYGIDVTQHE